MATEVSGYLRDEQPYSCIGIIQVTFPDGYQVRGTGTLVGINDILTATHVVYAPDHGGWANSYTFNFGADYNDNTGRFEDPGYSYSPTKWSTVAWPESVFTDTNNLTVTQSESQYDIAVIGVNAPIGDTLGWLGIDPGYNGSNSAKAVGYPAGATGMMQETVYVTENPYYNLYESYYDVMGPGASGGPLLMGNYVIGVLSTRSSWADVSLLFDSLVREVEENNSLLPTAPNDNADILTGTNGDDIINGGAGDDTIWGGDGDDSLVGNAGNDILDGGTGFDLASYSGERNNFSILETDTGFTVTDKTTGDSDTLTNIELLTFNDFEINLEIGENSQTISSTDLSSLEELYVAFFNRVPDANGLNYWIDQLNAGQSFDQIADQFYNAGVQYTDLTGFSDTMSTDEFVSVIYENVLGRSDATVPADEEGVIYWSNALDSGQVTRAVLIATMLSAAHTYKGDPTWGWVQDLLDNKTVVADYFAVQQGLNYTTPEESISMGMDIVSAVTPTDTTAAIQLIGINDTGFSLL